VSTHNDTHTHPQPYAAVKAKANIEVEFTLQNGAFATAVLREAMRNNMFL